MKSQRTVLIVTATLAVGGVERLIVSTAREMLSRGHYCPVVCNLTGRADLQAGLEERDIPYYPLGCSDFRWNLANTTCALRSLIRSCHPAIVHTHQFASDFYGMVASTGLRIPIVSHLHNPQMEHWSRQAVRNVMGAKLISAFVTVTFEKAAIVRKKIPSVSDRVFVLPNAIDIESLTLPVNYTSSSYRVELGIPNTAFIIGAVGRLSPEKGYDMLLCAFKHVIEKIPNAMLVIVGSGPEEAKLKSLSHEIGIEGKVLFTGYRTDIPEIMSLFDLFVISSRTEAFPMVALEAMYLGSPLLITEQVSAKDILGPVSHVVTATTEGLYHGIVDLLENGARRHQLVELGRELVLREFTMGSYLAKLELLYDEVLSRKS